MFANVPADVWWFIGVSIVVMFGLGYLVGRTLIK